MKKMYDLHTHSILSDGILIPSEIAVRYGSLGFKTIAITDHVDYSNYKNIISSIVEFTKRWPKDSSIKVLPGVELTHLPLEQFKPLSKYARKKGIKVIVAHGETLSEPVKQGTNRAALEAGVDILAHPGNIKKEDVELAKRKGIFLEITTRASHAGGNNHLVNLAKEIKGVRLILNTDSHAPSDIITPDAIKKNALSCALTAEGIEDIYKDVTIFIKHSLGKFA